MNRKFVLWGGTGQARVLHEALHRQNAEVLAIVDNRAIPSPLHKVPLLVGRDALVQWLHAAAPAPAELWGLAAIGGDKGQDRLDVLEIFRTLDIRNHTLVHDAAFVAMDATVGEGSQILARSAVCTHVRIGRGVIVNTAASVDHDSIVGDGVHIAPGATLAGEVCVERCALIGAGAVILPGITVGEHAVVGAGAVVTKNVPPRSVVVGNPAKIYK